MTTFPFPLSSFANASPWRRPDTCSSDDHERYARRQRRGVRSAIDVDERNVGRRRGLRHLAGRRGIYRIDDDGIDVLRGGILDLADLLVGVARASSN